MKQVQIDEHPPPRRGRHFWYVLEAVDPPTDGAKPLRTAPARHLWLNPHEVDLGAKVDALLRLSAWAEDNGWTVVE